MTGGATFRKADILTSVDITNQAIEELRSSGRGEIFFDDSFEYVMFSDGINLLRQVPNIESYGIISNGRMFDFTMPLMSPPVVSFPVWPTQNLDVLRDFRPLEDDVDIVMISEEVPGLGLVNDLLFPKMGKDFVLCRESALWQLFVRSIHAEKLCND